MLVILKMVLNGYWAGYHPDDGGYMEKIYSTKERIFYIIAIFLLGIITTVLFANDHGKMTCRIVAFLCLTLIVASFLKLLYIPSHIVFCNNTMHVFEYPLLATRRYYESSLVLWNSKIDISEVIEAELTELTKEERKRHVGYHHLGNKYLKLHLKYGKFKCVYVGMYSKHQIKKN